MRTAEAHEVLVTEDGTRYTVHLDSVSTFMGEGQPRATIWSAWVRRDNPPKPVGGGCKVWERYGFTDERAARDYANGCWTSIREGKRP
jgi:hypothetical protein